MQLTQKLWTLFFAFFLTHTIHAQTVEYDIEIEFGKFKVEKKNQDGSLLISAMQNESVFKLDSISSDGIEYNLLSIPIADLAYSFTDYLYEKNRGLFISYTAVDSNGISWDCRNTVIRKFDLQGSILWESTYNSGSWCDYEATRYLYLYNDIIYAIGSSYEDGDCLPTSVANILEPNSGLIISSTIVGSCFPGANGFNEFVYIPNLSNCTCGDNDFYNGDWFRRYDEHLNLLETVQLESYDYKQGAGKYVVVGFDMVDSNKLYSLVVDRYGHDNSIAIISMLENDTSWYNMNDSLGIDDMHSYRTKAIAVEDEYALVNVENYIRYDSLNNYNLDSTTVTLIFSNSDFSSNDTVVSLHKSNRIDLISSLNYEVESKSVFVTYTDTTNKLMRISLDAPLGIKQDKLFSHESSFEVYPNPTAGNVIVKSQEGGVVELYDITGKL